MKYFLHDSNAFNDEKITQLYIKFGYEGVGLFYTILEKLAQQEKPILTDVLKHQLKVGKKLDKVWKFIEEIELISSNNDETFNEQLLNFSKKYQIKKEKNAERIRQWRENHKDTENVTCNESVSNTSKLNKSKVKLSKEIKEDAFKIKFDNFISGFNLLTNRNFKGDIKTKRQLKDRLKEGYTGQDFSQAIKALYNDEFHKDNGFKFATPEFITRADKLEMFVNKEEIKKEPDGIYPGKLGVRNPSEPDLLKTILDKK